FAGVVQVHVSGGHALAVARVLGLAHGMTGLHQPAVAIDDEAGGRLVGLWHVLRDLGHAPVRRNVEVAPVFVQRAVEQAEQTGLAGAIAPDQADLLAGIDDAGGAIEQDLRTAAKDDVLEGDHAKKRPKASAVMSSTWSSPALVGSQTAASPGNARSKCSRSLPISSTMTPWGERRAGASARKRRMKSMPSAPPSMWTDSAISGSARYSGGSAAMLVALT